MRTPGDSERTDTGTLPRAICSVIRQEDMALTANSILNTGLAVLGARSSGAREI
jgi:hypothetical protein